MVKAILGEGEAALGHFERAMRLSPLDPAMGAFIAGTSGAHLLCGRYEEALAVAQRAIKEYPNFVGAHRLMVGTLGILGRTDEAKRAAQRLLELSPGFTVSKFQSVYPLRDPEFRKRIAGLFRAAGIPK